MKRILCYGDSNTWGFDPVNVDPNTLQLCRYSEKIRWTGVLQEQLGEAYRVWEAGLCGRTTAFEDPLMPIRSGTEYFEMVLQTCDPVDCIIFALGTNDTKDMFSASDLVITRAMERLLQVCRCAVSQSRSIGAKIILACPLKPVADAQGAYGYGFSELSTEKGEQLRWRYRDLAERTGCAYIDLNDLAVPSCADGVHLDVEGHAAIGIAMAQLVKKVLAD